MIDDQVIVKKVMNEVKQTSNVKLEIVDTLIRMVTNTTASKLSK